MNIIDQYKKLRKPDLLPGTVKIKSSLPTPTDIDYSRGYIIRYFVRKANDNSSPIYEISSNTYGFISNNSFYVGTKLKWRISGPIKPTYDKTGGIVDKGVLESNRISIKLASNSIKNLKLYLPNLLQFYK